MSYTETVLLTDVMNNYSATLLAQNGTVIIKY